MFCQACGVQNSEGARFCNMCGARIAAAGTPGGAVPAPTQLGVGREGAAAPVPSAGGAPPPTGLTGPIPPMANNTTSVSLEAIGVRTAKKTWAMIGAAALVFALLGIAGTYVAMRWGQPEPGAAAPEDPFTVGAPTVAGAESASTASGSSSGGALPEGVAPPEGLPSPTTSGGARPPSARPEGRTSGATSTSSTSAMQAQANDTSAMQGASETSMGTSSSGGESTPSTMEPAAGGNDGGAAGGSESPTEGDGTDRDLEMELYSGRVRYLVRRYYMSSATRCFDRATVNNPSLHGQVVVAITIGANGYVSDASVARNSTGDDTLGACLAGQARTWRLSPPPGGEPIQMNMPFSR